MTPLQKRTAQAIVNIFETGRIAGDYGSVTLIRGDSGHLTYGRSQTTLASGNLFLLIKTYCERPDAKFADELRPYLSRLSQRDLTLDRDISLREALKDAGHNDPAMHLEQDLFFDRQYFDPACRAAKAKQVESPLGQAVVYDSFIHGGFGKVAPRVGSQPDEHTWVQKYVQARREWLSSLKEPLPKTVYRMDSFKKLIDGGAWELPLTLTVRGHVISDETLGDGTPIVRAAAADPTDPPPARILYMTSPYMKGEDVKRVQTALSTAGFGNTSDGIYGPYTEALVKAFQKSIEVKVDGVVGPSTLAALGL